jgi:uncharacterized BrkB/YihY/UPF0761 family membrane protein
VLDEFLREGRMVSGLLLTALGCCFFLLAFAATIDVVRNNLPIPLSEELTPRARRIMSWLWPLLFLVLGVPCFIAGLTTSPFMTSGDWPWTVITAVLFLLGGILQFGKSLRGPRTPQRLQS